MEATPVYDHSDPYEELARSVIRVSFLLRRRLEEDLPGLSNVPREILRLVVRQPGLSVAAISQLLHKQTSNTSTAINQLVSQGLVQRERDVADKRSARIYPTEQATIRMRELYQAWAGDLRAWSSQLPAKQQDAILSAVEALTALTLSAEADTH